MKPRAWALLVVSSDQQAETIAHQRAWAKEAAAGRGWELEREFHGVSSGRDGPRKIVREMLVALRAAETKPAWLMMIRLDRLGREALECQFVLRDIRELGVKVWTREGGEERGDRAMERFVSAAKLYVAEQENEVRRDKMLAVYARRRAAGKPIGTKPPYGLTRTADGDYAPVRDQAKIVKLVFELRTQGLGYLAIARRVAPIAPPYRYQVGERPVRWGQNQTRLLIRNRAYIGTIVDEVTWRRAQSVRNAPLPPRRNPWPISGAVRCRCGYSLLGTASGRHARFRYYVCAQQHEGPRRFRADELEEAFVEVLRRYAADPTLIRPRSSPGPSRAVIDRALRTAQARLASVERREAAAFDLQAAGDMPADRLRKRLDALATERTTIEAEIAEIEAQGARTRALELVRDDAAAVLKRAHRTWRRAIPEQQQLIARASSRAIGGLWVDARGKLRIGEIPRPSLRATRAQTS